MCYMIVEVRRLVWDDWNVSHISRHDVIPEEVEAACHAQPVFFKETYKGRLMILGMTPAGRVLAIVIGPVPGASAGTFYPFTARTAHRSERREYARLREGAEP